MEDPPEGTGDFCHRPFEVTGNNLPRVTYPSLSRETSSATAAVQQRVTFNIGGVSFQTLEETVQKVANENFKLADPQFLQAYYDQARDEYFFDRDPEMFRSILNYWRTGNLHLPSTMCGPQVKEELDFWGLKELDIQPCCWNNFNTWMQSMNSLRKLEKDRQPSYMRLGADAEETIPTSACGRYRLAVWNILTDPGFSKAAKIYAYVGLLFVILAIFSFCAATHKVFQIDNELTHSDNVTISNSTTPQSTTSPPPPVASPCVATPSEATPSPDEKKAVEHGKITVHPALRGIDIACIIFFSLEYVIRLICAPNKFKFVISLTAIIDLLAILPDYVELLVIYLDVTVHAFVDSMPFLRLLRAFRIFRLIRRVPGLWIMIYTLKASFKELSLMLVFMLVGTLLFSSVIFFVDDTKIFTSIPHGFWWAVVTMTTVGYGDMAPVTVWGRIVGCLTAVCGVLIIGFTIPSLVSNFITFYQHVDFVVQKEKLVEGELKLGNRRKSMYMYGRPEACANHFGTGSGARDDSDTSLMKSVYPHHGNNNNCIYLPMVTINRNGCPSNSNNDNNSNDNDT